MDGYLLLTAVLFGVPIAGLTWAISRVVSAWRDRRSGAVVAGVVESCGWMIAPFYTLAAGLCSDDSWEWPIRTVLYLLWLLAIFGCGRAYDTLRRRGARRLHALAGTVALAVAGVLALTMLGNAVASITAHEYCG